MMRSSRYRVHRVTGTLCLLGRAKGIESASRFPPPGVAEPAQPLSERRWACLIRLSPIQFAPHYRRSVPWACRHARGPGSYADLVYGASRVSRTNPTSPRTKTLTEFIGYKVFVWMNRLHHLYSDLDEWCYGFLHGNPLYTYSGGRRCWRSSVAVGSVLGSFFASWFSCCCRARTCPLDKSAKDTTTRFGRYVYWMSKE